MKVRSDFVTNSSSSSFIISLKSDSCGIDFLELWLESMEVHDDITYEKLDEQKIYEHIDDMVFMSYGYEDDEENKHRIKTNIENAIKLNFNVFFIFEMSNWHSSKEVLHSLHNNKKICIINEENS